MLEDLWNFRQTCIFWTCFPFPFVNRLLDSIICEHKCFLYLYIKWYKIKRKGIFTLVSVSSSTKCIREFWDYVRWMNSVSSLIMVYLSLRQTLCVITTILKHIFARGLNKTIHQYTTVIVARLEWKNSKNVF